MYETTTFLGPKIAHQTGCEQCYGGKQKRDASAGNRTRVTRVAGEYSTTDAHMSLVVQELSEMNIIYQLVIVLTEPRVRSTLIVRHAV